MLKPDFLTPLNQISGIQALWISRIPEVRITGDKQEALDQLKPYHDQLLVSADLGNSPLYLCEQVHGKEVAIIQEPMPQSSLAEPYFFMGADGLATQAPKITLGIYVADCAAIWVVDQRTKAMGLLHSGKKGTELGILNRALMLMQQRFGTRAQDLVVVVSPCIRPPDYEVDFASKIKQQADVLGILHFHDCGLNTADDLKQYYSYRKELGKTGRMMALLTRYD